jgi:uncharacterized protein YuzE
MTAKPRLRRDDKNGLAYLHLTEVGPGGSVEQRAVSLADDEEHAELILDFDSSGRLVGIEFLRQDRLPPGW